MRKQMMRNAVIVILLVLFSITVADQGEASAPKSIDIVRDAQATSYLLLSADPSKAERLAAKELKSYIHQMTGAEIAIHGHGGTAPNPSHTPILLGRGEGHPIIKKMMKAGEIDLDAQALTQDGFVIKSAVWNKKPCLVVSGVSDHSTLYAAYDVLERFGRVGFFRYEEHVPKRASFVIPDCDVREKPFFDTRMHGGQYAYCPCDGFKTLAFRRHL